MTDHIHYCDEMENKYHMANTYASEAIFVNMNLKKLQYFLKLDNVKPIGK